MLTKVKAAVPGTVHLVMSCAGARFSMFSGSSNKDLSPGASDCSSETLVVAKAPRNELSRRAALTKDRMGGSRDREMGRREVGEGRTTNEERLFYNLQSPNRLGYLPFEMSWVTNNLPPMEVGSLVTRMVDG